MKCHTLLASPVLLGIALSILGCSEPKTSDAVILRSLDERRANAIVGQAIIDAGAKPARGRVFKLTNGVELFEDFSIDGVAYGVAFLSEQEVEKLGDGIPDHAPQSEQLRLIRPKKDAIVLLLYHQSYRYDVGDAHTVTVVTAEKKLEKDVRDFITHVVKQSAHR